VTQEAEKEKKTDVMLTMETKMVTFGGILLGILLLVIGVGASVKWVTYTGKFILPAALFWGGFYLKEDSVGVRITLIVLAGIVVIAGLMASSSIAALL
jgi:hypothetical protein